MKRWGVLIGFAVVALLLVAGIYMASRYPGFTRAIPSPLIGKPAPASVVATQWYAGESGANLDIASGTTLVVFFSDLNYIWSVFCRLLFFLTPVFFSAEIAGDGPARWTLELNPLTQLINVAREALLYGGPVGLGDIGLALLGPVVVLVFGALVFRAARARIPDYI